MKKKFVLTAATLLLISAFIIVFYYVRVRQIFPYQYRSAQNKACEEKCGNIYREDLIKCGKKCEDYVSGDPVYAFDSASNKCLYRADILGSYYYDGYIKDCNTNEYITRWNPTPEELRQNSGQVGFIMKKNAELLEALMGEQAEFFLLDQ